MKRSLENFAKRSAAARFQTFGVTFIFRGQEVTGTIAVSRQPIELIGGGYRMASIAVARLPLTVQPPPREKESLLEKKTGITWQIVSAAAGNTDSAAAQEHVFDVAIP